MKYEEIVELIQDGVKAQDGAWADFGAGDGAFTQALHDLLAPSATIYAVDKNPRALNKLSTRMNGSEPVVRTVHADFTRDVSLPPLDGILMANALHWVRRQHLVMTRVHDWLKPGGTLLLVEYDVATPRPYIPYPVGYTRFSKLAVETGFGQVSKIGVRRSPSTGVTMTAAIATRY